MKQPLLFLSALLFVMMNGFSQNNPDKVQRTAQKIDNGVNRARNIIDVFQPYLLKARALYGEAKQLGRDVKSSARGVKNNNGYEGAAQSDYSNNSTDPAAGYPTSASSNTSAPVSSNASPAAENDPGAQYGVYNNYTPQQYLPINNEAAINSDGTGNWGNQNNGLYGNCLDVLTGTVMGMGEAEENPASIDLMFFAPADGQNTYVLMTPAFVKNNATATYMTQHASDGVLRWKDISESEVALTKLTTAQFEKIQNNNQITGAVKNAVNYSGWYTSVGNKLEGQVFAVRVEQENRTVYALVSVVKHYGTSGSNGYLKIKVKSQGIDRNGDGYVDPSSYIR